MSEKPSKTIRLLMPQWQGGNQRAYSLGARLLAWLAPDNASPLIEVPVEPFESPAAELEKGMFARAALLQQLKATRRIIDDQQPDRIVMFGGDCLVDQAPFSYLNERYGGRLGVLWIDAHPDVANTTQRHHAHTMVLGNLLGEGDEEFAREVRVPLQPSLIAFVGLGHTFDAENDFIERHALLRIDHDALSESPHPVTAWIKAQGIEHLAIHLDLDALSPEIFRSVMFGRPGAANDAALRSRRGHMTFDQVRALIAQVSKDTDVVALGITEHMPWDALALQDLLAALPILAPS